MIKQKLDQIIASHALIFNSDQDYQKTLEQLESKFQVRGSIIVNRLNSQEIMQSQFETVVFETSRPYLRVKSQGRFSPAFVDQRDSSTISSHQKEVEKVVRHYFDKLGLVFKGENLNINQLRDAAASRISQRFLYEADNQGRIVFRKFSEGMFSKPFDPQEIIRYYTAGFLDESRTHDKREGLKQVIRKEVLERMGYQSVNSMDLRVRDQFERAVSEKENEAFIAYTRKRLPVASQEQYREEFMKRALHKFGLVDIRQARLDEVRQINAYADSKVADLNDFKDNLEILQTIANDIFSGRESWPGLESVENTKGFVLRNDLI